MKYNISIEGGFSGITKVYEGELPMDEKEQANLLDSMSGPAGPLNPRMADGLIYRIRLYKENLPLERVFDDANLPMPMRFFLRRITTQQKK